MQFLWQMLHVSPCFKGPRHRGFVPVQFNSESQEAHSIRILQVETCRGLARHSGIVVNFVSDIAMHELGPVSIIHMEDYPCTSMLHSANLDTYILNLHAQYRATVCTLQGNMYSSSMCAQLVFVSWYFQILLFF